MPRQRKPEGMPGRTPPQNKAVPPTPPAEMNKRRQLMREMLLRSQPRDQIRATFEQAAENGQLSPINDVQFNRLYTEGSKALEELTIENVHIEKMKAKQRLHGHIAKASAAGHHGAVMAGERLLAEISGTLAPTVVQFSDTTQALTNAIVEALTEIGPAQLEAMLEEGDVAPIGGVVVTTATPMEPPNGASNGSTNGHG